MSVFYTELKQTVLNSWNVKTIGVCRVSRQGRIQGGDRPPPKIYKLTLFTMIAYNSENNIRNARPFCHPLFCHSSVVKCTSSLLQWWTRNETWLPNITEIAPITLLARSAPRSKRAFAPLWKLGQEPKFSRKFDVRSSMAINWFNSCNLQ